MSATTASAPAAETAEQVVRLLRRHRFALNDEKRLQGQMHEAIVASGLPAEREVVLAPASRIDILVAGNVGIEVKIKGQARSIHRQCERYCGFDRIAALILATNRAMGFPSELAGKPVFVLELGRAWL